MAKDDFVYPREPTFRKASDERLAMELRLRDLELRVGSLEKLLERLGEILESKENED